MDYLPIQKCPRCGAEFQPHVLTCLDCGAATVAAWEGESEEAGQPAPADGPCPEVRSVGPADAIALVFAGDPGAVEPLQDRLRANGVPYRLEIQTISPRLDDRYQLFVRPDDYVRARELQLDLFRRDAPEAVDLARQLDLEHCPFCGTEVGDARPIECPTCGLVLGGGGDSEAGEAQEGEEPGGEGLRNPPL